MSIPTVRFAGSEYSLETLGNLSGPELVKLHNNCAGLIGVPETKRFSDKSSALKRTWAVLKDYDARNLGTYEDVVSATPGVETVTEGPEMTLGEMTAHAEVEARSRAGKEEHEVAAAKRKAPSKPAKKAVAEQGGRGFPEDAKIKILVKENPRRGAAAERFEIYKNGMTVAEYSKKIGSRAEALVHLRWDVNKGHISVG